MTMPQEMIDKTTAQIQSSNMLNEIYSLIDEAAYELEQVTRKPLCVDGCGKCCEHNTPVVTNAEVSHIMSYVGCLPGFQALTKRCLDWMDHKHPGVKGKHLNDIRELQSEANILAVSQCPFLNSDDKTCSIWEVRPLVCRTYGVTVVADDWCESDANNRRMSTPGYLVEKDTPLGQRIQKAKRRFFDFITNVIPEHRVVGFLPSLISERMAASQVSWMLERGKFPDAKIGRGLATPDLFMDRNEKVSVVKSVEVNRNRGILAGDYDSNNLSHLR